ncbi:hypothetical protein PFISCL1PPCAC_22150, partial [Pristionchus fissidentatus]
PPSLPPESSIPTITGHYMELKELLLGLHEKIDAVQPCECSSLKLELAQIKSIVSSLSSTPPPTAPSTYTAVKKGMEDAVLYADKQKRAVWIGKPEGSSPEETLESDQLELEKLVIELKNDEISSALEKGEITHHRHPKEKPGKRRILKFGFTSQKIRDMFLFEIRKIHPTTITDLKGSFMRRDLCPMELELERQARYEAFKLNLKMNCLAYGVCDERLIQFRQPYRALPLNYADRDPSRKKWKKQSSPSHNSSRISQSSRNNDLISVFLANVRSIRKKSHILSFIKSLDYSMILLNETWLSEDDSDAFLLGSNANYVSFRKDRPTNAAKSRGGGVAILCSPLLNPILISSFSTDDIEAITIDIHTSSYCKSIPFSSVRVCLIYRAPSCTNASLESLLTYLESIVGNSPLLISGDLNFPDIDWYTLTSPSQNDFLSFVADYRFSQYVNFKTRAQNILDLVLCNSNIIRNIRPSIPISDHTSISFSLAVASPRPRPFVPSRVYHLADWVMINSLISDHNWTMSLAHLDMNSSYEYFCNFMNSVLDTYVPKTTRSSSSPYPRHLRILYNKSNRIAMIAPNSTLAHKLSHRFERALREHNVRVENKIVNSNNAKAFFALCKTRLKSTSNASPGIIDLTGKSIVTDRDKAHAFSLYFASYTINGNDLIPSPSMKDLGVIMQPSLKFSDHVSKLTSKARSKVNIMFKCFYSNDPLLYLQAFNAFIRPLLEYCTVVWSPRTVKLANFVENVQRNFTRRVFFRCAIPYSPYPDRLNFLSMSTLEQRRLIFDLLFLHKTIHNFYSLNSNLLFKISPLTRNLRNTHKLRIALPFAVPKSHSTFATRTVQRWNALPGEIVNSSPNVFRSHILNLPSISFTSESLLRL